MAYIGRVPQVGNYFTLDAITTSSTDTYNLLKDGVAYVPETAYHLIVSLNGVIQAPITAFTVSGSQIIFASTLSASDSIDFITVLGDVLSVGTPSDGTVTNAKIVDMAATKLTGSIADARVPSSAVTQHVTGYDDSAIRADISALALREATNETSAAFNLPNSFIDTFATDVLGTKTNAAVNSDGYVSTIVAETFGTLTTMTSANWNIGTLSSTSFGTGTMTHGTSPDEDGMGQTNGASSEISFPANTPFQFSFVGSNSTGHAPFVNFQSTSNAPTGNPSNTSTFMTGGRKTNNSFQLLVDSSNNGHQFREIDSSGSETLISSGTDFDGATTLMTRDTNGTVRLYKNGSLQSTSSVQVTDAMIIAMGGTGGNAASASSVQYSVGTASLANATGTIIQAANTLGSAKSEVSGTMIYKDNAGTTTLGTDLKIYFTCDGGSNWTEASSYNAITPVYATGIKQVRLGKTTCTSGTDVRYKAVWANQALASKETQLHGIGINY